MLLSIRYELSSPLDWWFGGRVLLPWGIIFLVIDVATMILILSCYLDVLFRRMDMVCLLVSSTLDFFATYIISVFPGGEFLCLPSGSVLLL